MQVTIETLEGLERKMTVQVPADKIASAVEQKLKQVSKTVKLDGFRPGKVPVNVVKKMYGAQIRHEVMGDMIESSYRDAIIEQKVRPAGMPKIEAVEAEEGAEKDESMTYSAVFEVYPEVESVEMDSIEIEKPAAEIADSDVDAMIDKLRGQRKEWVEVERAAATDDQVICDFEGKIDGEVFAGGSGKDMAIEIGAGKMLKEFEEGLLGMSKGEEKTVDVNFPEDYHGKDVAGKTAQFTLNVTKVSEPKLPEMNEELVKSFGVESGDVEAFKADVRGNMEKELSQKIKTHIKNTVMAGLLDKNEIIAPKAMVDEEIKNLKMQMAQNMGQDPAKMDTSAFPDDLFREEGSRRVQLGLLVGELIRIEKIKLDQAKLESTLQEMAATYEEPQQVLEYYTKNREAKASLEGLVLEDQVVEHILGKAKVTEKTVNFEDMMNGQVK